MKQLYAVLMDFALRHGAASIKNLPECWEHTWVHAGNTWFVAVHARDGDRKTSTGALIPPGTFWIEVGGLPFGTVGPTGGCVAAGSAINERTLREALAPLTGPTHTKPFSGDLVQ